MEKTEVEHLDTACEQISMGKALDTPILNPKQEIYWAIATFSSHTCGLRGSGGCGVLWLGLHGFPYLTLVTMTQENLSTHRLRNKLHITLKVFNHFPDWSEILNVE